MTIYHFIIILDVSVATLLVIGSVVCILQLKEINGVVWKAYLLIYRTTFLITGSMILYLSLTRWNHWLALVVTSLMGIGLIGNWYDKDRKKYANND